MTLRARLRKNTNYSQLVSSSLAVASWDVGADDRAEMFTPHWRTSRVSEDVFDSLKHKLIRRSLQLAALASLEAGHSEGFLSQRAI